MPKRTRQRDTGVPGLWASRCERVIRPTWWVWNAKSAMCANVCTIATSFYGFAQHKVGDEVFLATAEWRPWDVEDFGSRRPSNVVLDDPAEPERV